MANGSVNDKIEFIDTSSECINMMIKLTKSALKDGGKIVTDVLKQEIPVRTGGLQKSIKAWAKVNYKTGQPYLEVGYLSKAQMKKKYGIKYFVNPTWFEFGTKPHTIMTKQMKNNSRVLTYELEGNGRKYGYSAKHPGMSNKNFLRNTTFRNIDKIQNAIQEGLCKLDEFKLSDPRYDKNNFLIHDYFFGAMR